MVLGFPSWEFGGMQIPGSSLTDVSEARSPFPVICIVRVTQGEIGPACSSWTPPVLGFNLFRCINITPGYVVPEIELRAL